MLSPQSLRTSSSRFQIINTSDVVEDAIRNKDPDAAKVLINKRNKREFTYKTWAILIENGVKHLDNDLRNEFRCILVDLAGDKIRTYLRTALQALEEEPVAVFILERRPDLFLERLDGGEIAFHLAVSNGEAQVVEMFLGYLHKTNRQDLMSPKMGDASQHEQRVNQHSAILEKAAERGHIEVVKMLVEFDPKLLGFGFPLHKAVRGGKFEIVEFLLQEKPNLVEQLTPEPNPRSALFEERTLGKEDKTSLEIDKLLVARIIRARGPGKSPRMIKKLLQGPQDTEISLDLSMFSRRTHKFKLFVDCLLQEQQPFDIRFHPTLLYVHFPYLDASYQSSGPTAIGTEAEKMLQWLRTKKSVTEIIELRVPGSTPRAESEEVIAKALSGISVDILDWRVLDLSIDIIIESRAKNVEELHLYSSGNWGVLQQWSGIEGVTLLPQLKRLEITIVKGMISEELEHQHLERLNKRLLDANLANLKGRPSPAPEVSFQANAGPWKHSESSTGSRQQFGNLQETNVTITKLKHFLNFYASCDKDDIQPTKVAIIDNGIDGTLSSLSKRIIDGIDPDLVAQAIEWAVGLKVDIISMSLALPNGVPRLQKAVETAKGDNIVMVGSRGDRGNNQERVFPADYAEVISISSLTSLGKRTESTETNAQYFLQGENVSIPAEPSYLESQKHASGSSVATALAAGVAALTLSCRKLVLQLARLGLGLYEAR